MINFFTRSFSVFSLLLLTLTGCTSTPNDDELLINTQTTEQRLTQLAQLQQWKIQGKIAFIDSNSRHSATLNWLVDEKLQNQQLDLTSYLGINVLQLSSTNDIHTIKVDGKTYQDDNLTDLIYSLTGLTLPTKALTYWLKGLPYIQSDNIIYQESTALPQSLTSYYNNDLWQITYTNYKEVDGYFLATKFSIEQDDLLIKIIINNWSLH